MFDLLIPRKRTIINIGIKKHNIKMAEFNSFLKNADIVRYVKENFKLDLDRSKIPQYYLINPV